eukprot:123423_1
MTLSGFKRSTLSHVAESVIIVILFVVAMLLDEHFIIGVRKQVVPGASIYSRPDGGETITNAELVLYSALPWYILFVFDLIFFRVYDASFTYAKWLKQFYVMQKTAFFSVSIELITADIVKNCIGNPQPWFNTAL